jgi:hypothetical protein
MNSIKADLTSRSEQDATASEVEHLRAINAVLLASLEEIYEFEEGPGETDRPMMARAKAAIAAACGGPA